jgi:DNA polymerase I-like protein with 3'-5' exonuclease and polymerase domains
MLKYGIYGYDEESDLYKIPAKGEKFNRMHEMPLESQLFYCGIDSWLTNKLWNDQQESLSYNLRGAKFFMKGANTFSDMTWNGMSLFLDHYKAARAELTKEITEIEQKILNSDEVKNYLRDNHLKVINLKSTPQLKDFFVDYLGCQVWKYTASGKASMDAESLEKMDHWIAAGITEYRKLLKIRDTYINQYETACTNEFLHPSYTLHIARSLRSTSLNPNAQNIPKHNVKAKNICRGGIHPRKGRMLLEADFSGIEVVTAALYHKDPKAIEYLVDPNADMHRDNAAQLWMCSPDDVSKEVRAFQKGTWTFPQQYGDYYVNCAKNTWEGRHLKLKNGKTCLESIEEHGIFDLDSYTEYLREAEEELWQHRFKVYTQWKLDQCNIYKAQGYVDTFFGFRFGGRLDRKQLSNFPIQGTAFHILLWCLIYLHKIAMDEGWESKFVGEIHDSMILDIVPEEAEYIIRKIKHVCEKVVVDRFDWINLPFEVDIELTKINGNFSEFYGIDLRKEGGLTIKLKGDEKIEIINPTDWEQWVA